MLESILNLFFPNVCGFCGKIEKSFLCENCLKIINPKLTYDSEVIDNQFFDKHIYMLKYEGIIRKSFLHYKFDGRGYMYKSFAKIILSDKILCDILKNYDIICPVPIHNKRKKERGYDQSVLIAKDIAKNIDNLRYINCLRKIRNTKRQSMLKEAQRINNAKNVYMLINKERIYNKKIVLFDDIYTTGATMNECARILKTGGASNILALSIAK